VVAKQTHLVFLSSFATVAALPCAVDFMDIKLDHVNYCTKQKILPPKCKGRKVFQQKRQSFNAMKQRQAEGAEKELYSPLMSRKMSTHTSKGSVSEVKQDKWS